MNTQASGKKPAFAESIETMMRLLGCKYQACVPEALGLNRTIVNQWKKLDSVTAAHLVKAADIAKTRHEIAAKSTLAQKDEVLAYLGHNAAAAKMLEAGERGAVLLMRGLGFLELFEEGRKSGGVFEAIRVDAASIAEELGIEHKTVNVFKADEKRWGKRMYELLRAGAAYEKIESSYRFGKENGFLK